MRNKNIKRIISGVLAVAMCATFVPVTTIATEQDNTKQVESMSYADMLAQLTAIEECYSLPYFMVSEGDSVYINGEKVATTTIEVDRELAFSESSKKYWLDATAYGSYEALERAANDLNAYIASTRTDVQTAEKNLTDTLKAIRDYCLSKNLPTYNSKDSESYKLLTGHKITIPANIKLVRPENLQKTTTTGTNETEVQPLTYRDAMDLYGTNTKAEYDFVEKLMGLRINADGANYIAVGAPLTGVNVYNEDGSINEEAVTSDIVPGQDVARYTAYLMQVTAEQSIGFDVTMQELFGDSTTTSADWHAECLKDMSSEELAYACAVISSNLKLINTYEYYLTEKQFDLYDIHGKCVARMTLPEYFAFLAKYDYEVPEAPETPNDAQALADAMEAALRDTIINRVAEELGLETHTENTEINTVEDASYTDASATVNALAGICMDNAIFTELDNLTAKLCNIVYPEYVTLQDNVYTYNCNSYIRKTGNYVDATIEPAGVLKNRNDKRDSVILNMPTELVPAWYTFYDTSMGYDAFTERADPTLFEGVYNDRAAVVDGAWDYGATRYDVVKYVTEYKDVNGVPTVTKKALTDADGNLAHYGKQNEVTPWINYQYLVQVGPESVDAGVLAAETDADARVYKEYATWATHETFRNLNRTEEIEEWYNPHHPEKYTVSESPDMTVMLRENGYDADGTEVFNCTGMRVSISRFAMDDMGSDAIDAYTYIIDFDKYPASRYDMDVTEWLEAIFAQEASSISKNALDDFTEYLAYMKPELTDVDVAAYQLAYLRYLTGFNIHNGYAFTIDYIYECDDLAVIPDSTLANLKGVNKVLLTEIPEYSISEYYEDKTDFFKLSDVRSGAFTPENNVYNLLVTNPDKLYTENTNEYTFTSATSTDWTKLLSKYAMNRSLGYIGSHFTVPIGYSVRLPAYIPVSGRTVDTRYYVRYIPFTDTGFPTPNNTAYYAVDMSNIIGPDLTSFASMTTNGSPAYRTLTVADDKATYYTTFYALDRGVNTVGAVQRIMSPVVPFTVTGDTVQNLNNNLTVGGVLADENGYQGTTFGVAVAEQGLPTLVWDSITGNVINQDTDDKTYSGDVHVWVSKSSAKDGIIAADWVNTVPEILKDAIVTTNTSTGIYDADAPTVSVERPSTATAGNAVKIKSGVTTGTFADWAFKRTLTKARMPYCLSCGKFVADAAHHRALNYTYCRRTEVTTQSVEWVAVEVKVVNKNSSANGTESSGTYVDAPPVYTDHNGNTQKQSTNKPHKDYSNLQIFDVEGVGRGLSGQEVWKAVPAGTLGKLGENFYVLTGFTFQKGFNTDAKMAAQELFDSGALKAGDKVSCLSIDPETNQIYKYTIQAKENGFTSVSEGDDSVTITVYEPRIITTTTVTYIDVPNIAVVCSGDWVYADVWTVSVGNSPYKAPAEISYGTCGPVPAKLKAPVVYNNIRYMYTGGTADTDVFNQQIDSHANHNDYGSVSDSVNENTDSGYDTEHKYETNSVYPYIPHSQRELVSVTASEFGVYAGDTSHIAAVFEVQSLDALYNNAVRDSVTPSNISTAHKFPLKTYRDVMIVNMVNWYKYVGELFNVNSTEETAEETAEITETTATFTATPQATLEKLVRVFSKTSTAGLASVNAIVCPSLGINDAKNETFADVTEANADGTKGVATVKLPDLTYVPYTVINNINGVTKSGDSLDYTITSITKTPRYDIFGNALDTHEYRTEQYTSQYKTKLIPEVLMTYKDSFLDESGKLLNYEDRGALNSLYIAGYNKYSMDLPMYNKATLNYDFDATDFDTVGAATAKGTKASKLTTLADVLYTGTEVSTVADTDKTPSIDFKSYVLDFANPNIGTAWNPDYTADTALKQAQSWLNTYKGQNASDTDSFEYTANLSVTYSKDAAYQATSNAVNSSISSTISVDSKQMKPIEVTQQYSFDLTNSDGANNTYALLAQYPVTVRNGRLATISVDDRTYVLYGDGSITTTEALITSTGFEKLRTDYPDVAEAVANMKLPEFASTLTHNGGSQNWKTYEGTAIYTDNTTKTVPDEVGEERSAYDPNYANDTGWYSEDTTVLTIKLYGISGNIDNHYAFTYKIPLDYGYNSPKNKADLFKAGTAIYAYNEMYFRFENTALNEDGAVSGTFDITGDEGANNLANKPEIAYVISNATVNDMTR